jgi:hypothetical protein
MDRFSRASVSLRDAEQVDEISQARAASLGFDGTWISTSAMFAVLKRVSRVVAAAKRDQLDAQALESSVSKGIWQGLATAVIIGAIISGIIHWF